MTNPIILALDSATLEDARALASRAGDAVGGVKVGLELWNATGPDAATAFEGHRLFLDLKLHDIPNTVAGAVRAVARLGAELVNVHALGGRAMMKAANQEKGATKVIAVTILTSLDDLSLKELGLPPARETVPMLAELAAEAGCDGVVCAPTDVAGIRRVCPRPFLIVTPGIRPAGAAIDDQARVATPRAAMEAGADRLVVGRPISRAPDPRAAARAILEELR